MEEKRILLLLIFRVTEDGDSWRREARETVGREANN
jgi:hypothetical protein